MNKKRITVPIKLRRQLFVECGHKCSVHNCHEMQNLEGHHINSNPSDNRSENIIMLCPNHHTMADRKVIDRKSCKMYKGMLGSGPITGVQILESIDALRRDISKLDNQSKNNEEGKK